MVKIIALYKQPQDIDVFERKYFSEHLPLVKKMPNLLRVEISRITGSPQGKSPFFMMAEMYFDDMDRLKAGIGSAEGAAANKSLETFASNITTVMFSEVD